MMRESRVQGGEGSDLLGVPVPECPEAVVVLVDLAGGELEGDGLVGLGGEEEVLPALVRRLHLLLVGGHEAVPRLDPLRHLREVHLEEQRLLALRRLPLLRHLNPDPHHLDRVKGRD